MAKTEKRALVRTLVGLGLHRGQTYIEIQDLMLFLLSDIENYSSEVAKDRRHIVEELRKLMEK